MGKRIIYMQYPFDSDNSFYDGLIHQIVPNRYRPVRIRGYLFWVMDYYDLSLGSDCTTLLTQFGGRFYKVPLDNESYRVLFEFLYEHPNIQEYPADKYGTNGDIALAQSMSIYPSDFLPTKGVKKPFELRYYLPVDNNHYPYFENSTFSFTGGSIGGMTLPGEKHPETYNFRKKPICAEIARGLYGGLIVKKPGKIRSRDIGRNNFIYDEGVDTYSFTTYIPEGTTASVRCHDGHGGTFEYSVAFIPGEYRIIAHYADVADSRVNDDILNCDSINITANNIDYPDDLHEIPIIWKDGCDGKIEMELRAGGNQIGYYPPKGRKQ